MTDVASIASFKIFKGLNESQLQSVLQLAEHLEYQQGDVVLEESSVSNDLFVLLKGRTDVEIMATQTGRNEKSRKRLAILRVGDAFGEMAFLDSSRRSARVAAFDDIKVLKLNRERFYELFEKDPALGFHFMHNLALILAQRLIELNFMWRDEI